MIAYVSWGEVYCSVILHLNLLYDDQEHCVSIMHLVYSKCELIIFEMSTVIVRIGDAVVSVY